MSIALASKGLYGGGIVDVTNAITVELPLVYTVGGPGISFSIDVAPTIVYAMDDAEIVYTTEETLTYTVGGSEIIFNVCECND